MKEIPLSLIARVHNIRGVNSGSHDSLPTLLAAYTPSNGVGFKAEVDDK